MYQEFVLPLALIYAHSFPGGEDYLGSPRMVELVRAGIRYAACSSHKDGSCDDYFPYERALGAVAFSLYAMTESCLILDLREKDITSFLGKRGLWLLSRDESGILSNHHALAVLALYNVYLVTGEEPFRAGARKKLNRLLTWQHAEGWFPEYEGCDPGYLTATIDFLAKYHKKSGDKAVLKPLESALRFASRFMHPDGSYGGEYGSRNTSLFFPHGFELMSERVREARAAADRYLDGIARDRRVHLDDDRMCSHLTYNHLQAYIDYRERDAAGNAAAPTSSDAEASSKYWPGAKLFNHVDECRYAVVSTSKGGVFRLYVDGDLVAGDSGLVMKLDNGAVLVSHLVSENKVDLTAGGISVEGHFGTCRFKLPTPLTQAVFHVGMLALGRIASNLVRSLLQKMLIVGKRFNPMRFKRTFLFKDEIRLIDEIWKPENGKKPVKVSELYAGTDHTSIYVAMSRSWQAACLLPWTDYGEHVEDLNRAGYIRVERVLK